jgi:hypothetical protein
VQMGRRHSWASDVIVCPYCGEVCHTGRKFRDHIKRACSCLEVDRIPASQVRRIRQQDLDNDPCYAPLYEVHLSSSVTLQQSFVFPTSGCMKKDVLKEPV